MQKPAKIDLKITTPVKIPTQQNTNRGVSRQPLRLQTEKKLWISKDI
jgi:hypothetical protein